MTASLQVTGLCFGHPDSKEPTLRDIDLWIEAGSMTSVVGASGSGKSSLLRLISGLNEPIEGDIQVGGRSVLGRPPEQRGITMMFQKPHLFEHLNVLDNVAFADTVAGVPKAKARANAQVCLDVVHLGEMGPRRTRQLSGGQEQRVALARALAARPEVLLLDEPFSSLDTELRASMHQLLGEVRAEMSPTIVMVTHDMSEAALGDKVAVLVDGTIAQHGALSELYAGPASASVARVLGGFTSVPGIDGLVRQERVQVMSDHNTGSPGPKSWSAVVTSLSWAGARQIAVVDLDAPQSGQMTGEVALGESLVAGQRVRLALH